MVVAPGVGVDMLVSRASFEAEKALSGALPKARTACRPLAQRLCLAIMQCQQSYMTLPN
ncbi:hypothetical protein SODG_005927 [Sodalis praecaptivus]